MLTFSVSNQNQNYFLSRVFLLCKTNRTSLLCQTPVSCVATVHRTRPEHSSPWSGKKPNIASEHNPPSIPLIFRKQGCPTLQHTGIRAATRSCKNFKQIVDGAETAPGNIKYWRAILFSLHCKSAHLASLFSCTTAYNEN